MSAALATVEDTRVDVLGVHVSAVNMEMAVERIASWVDERTRTYVCVTGAHGVIESQDDDDLLKIHNNAGMVTPDGMPLVWSSRRAGAHWVDRVYGPDLVLELGELGAARGWSFFYFGGDEGVAAEFGAELERRFPGVKTAGSYCPPFRPLTDAERRDIAELINASGADLVLVGLSTPKQERWMSAMRPQLEAPVLVGVGAAFDFHTGRVRQAPGWVQRSGLEWAYRLCMEPRRLWRRYSVVVPTFAAAVLKRPPEWAEETHT